MRPNSREVICGAKVRSEREKGEKRRARRQSAGDNTGIIGREVIGASENVECVLKRWTGERLVLHLAADCDYWHLIRSTLAQISGCGGGRGTGVSVLMRPGTVTLPTTMYSEPRYVAFPVKPCPKPSLHSSVHVYEEIADPATFFHGGHVTQDYDTTPFLDACHVAKDAESFHDEGLSRHTSAGVRADDFICDHAVSVS
ncbi:hypothetical protein BaRGS_00017278 [Batillaria attramentaria]|uniref:Uncharacterized protein n=1 Tax=Batillaria attramentaria TaxID=370345 RepID=A0ABD0KWG6_9CAEN